MSYLNYLMSACFGSGVGADGANSEGGSQWYVIVAYIVIFVVFIYFIMVRPQRKQRQKQQDTMNQMEPGDSVLTTSGFYGTIVSVTADTVIVEFGNNKNCRIPMAKQAISQVEKAGAAAQTQGSAQPESKKKIFDKAQQEAEQVEDIKEDVTDSLDEAVEGIKEDIADTAGDVSKDAVEAVEDVAGDK